MIHQTPIPFGDYLNEYPEAKELVMRLRKRPDSLETIPGYLGHGVDKDAFRVGEHVIKLVRLRPQRPYSAQLRPLQKSLGLHGAEQLISSSAQDRMFATHFVTGPQIMRLPALELTGYITPRSVTSLTDTMTAFQERGLYVDSLSGIFASETDGAPFSVIDPIDSPRDATNDPAEVMKAVSQWRVAPGTERIEARPYAEVVAIRDAFISALRAPDSR